MLSLRLSGELNWASLWRRLDSDRITGSTWISFVSDCVFGFVLFILDFGWIYTVCIGFSLDLRFGTWRRISDFRLFVWLCFICLESLGPKGEC